MRHGSTFFVFQARRSFVQSRSIILAGANIATREDYPSPDYSARYERENSPVHREKWLYGHVISGFISI